MSASVSDRVNRNLSSPLLAGLCLAPDGQGVVCSATVLDPDGVRYRCAILRCALDEGWHKITPWSSSPCMTAFLPDGSLLVTGTFGDDEEPALWSFGSCTGPHRLLALPSPVHSLATAREADTVCFISDVFRGAQNLESDRQLRRERAETRTHAVLLDDATERVDGQRPCPLQPRVFLVRSALSQPGDWSGRLEGLTPAPQGRVTGPLALSPDGRLVLYSWTGQSADGLRHAALVCLDTVSGTARALGDEEGINYLSPAFSPDGRSVVCVRESYCGPGGPPQTQLWFVDVAGGTGRPLDAEVSVRPQEPVFSPGGDCVYYVADEDGHRPVFRLDLARDDTVRLTSRGSYSDVRPSPRDGALFALCSGVDTAPRPVQLRHDEPDQQPVFFSPPADRNAAYRHIERVETAAEHGIPVRGWLLLPQRETGAGPAPLIAWLHGGPRLSNNFWSWPLSPWVLVENGYAILTPDPGMSTGYGEHFEERGSGRWGREPYTDTVALVEAVAARDDIDEASCAVLGVSFGGYLANWIATQTDRFVAVVSHAGIWNLPALAGTTDQMDHLVYELGSPVEDYSRYASNSPHLRCANITAPVLAIHGDWDYRVPVEQSIQMLYDIRRSGGTAHLLYLPGVAHTPQQPADVRTWFTVVTGFLDQHLRGVKWQRSALI